MTYLKERQYYENIHDNITVEWGRRNTKMFNEMRDKFFEIMPDEPRDSPRAILHLNMIYIVFVGTDLLNRYDKRDDDVREMMARDEAKDQQVNTARLTVEPKCQHCNSRGLRLTDKMLCLRYGTDETEEVLFMLNCPKCQKNSAVWSDGHAVEQRRTTCPKCNSVMKESDSYKGKVLTTTYTCPSCGHHYKDRLDFTLKKKKADPNFENDRAVFCLFDEKVRQEFREAKLRYEEMARLGREWKEKEENKHIYDAIAEIKKPKIAELIPILRPKLEEAGYIEFNLDPPEIGRVVFVGFSCLDSKSDRENYESSKVLKTVINQALEATNWRLTSDGISYRLGYLTGRLRAYEQEDELKRLVCGKSKINERKKSSLEQNIDRGRILGSNGDTIIL